jgi:preprotein translocase subunit YajC
VKDAASLLPIVAIAAIFWLLIIRPASRQRKEAASLQAALTVGDDVMLTSGIFGTVTGEADDHLRVEIAPGVVIRVVRGAVASVRRDAEPAPDVSATDSHELTDRPDDEEER